MNSLKQKLHQACSLFLDVRISSLELAIKDIQRSANEETKSTAGDKYETGRAMAQLEIEKYRSQLAEALRMKQELLRVPLDNNIALAKPGSLVFTSRGNFYIAINAGQHRIEHEIFFTISAASPIARKLIGLKVDDTVIHNNQEFTILRIQ